MKFARLLAAGKSMVSGNVNGRYQMHEGLRLPQFISPNIMIASPKVQNLVDNLPGTPKFTDVWLTPAA